MFHTHKQRGQVYITAKAQNKILLFKYANSRVNEFSEIFTASQNIPFTRLK